MLVSMPLAFVAVAVRPRGLAVAVLSSAAHSAAAAADLWQSWQRGMEGRPTGMAMPEPPWASGKGGSGSAGDFRGARDFGKGRGSGAGGPTWVEGGSHRSGYKLRITGFPPAAVQPLSAAWIKHWLHTEWSSVDPVRRTMSVEALVEATVDVNWNHAAQSGGGRGLGSREGEWSGGGMASVTSRGYHCGFGLID